MMRPIDHGKELPDELKYAMEKASSFHEGKTLAMTTSLPYYEGLRDAGIKGAQDVIDAIEKHERVEIFLSY